MSDPAADLRARARRLAAPLGIDPERVEVRIYKLERGYVRGLQWRACVWVSRPGRSWSIDDARRVGDDIAADERGESAEDAARRWRVDSPIRLTHSRPRGDSGRTSRPPDARPPRRPFGGRSPGRLLQTGRCHNALASKEIAIRLAKVIKVLAFCFGRTYGSLRRGNRAPRGARR